MQRRSVAGYLFGVVVNGDPETFMGEVSHVGLENQIVPNDPQRFQIGRAAFGCLLPSNRCRFSAAQARAATRFSVARLTRNDS
jgi:hypothetical protein